MKKYFCLLISLIFGLFGFTLFVEGLNLNHALPTNFAIMMFVIGLIGLAIMRVCWKKFKIS